MKKYILLLLFIGLNISVEAQKNEFDKACRIIFEMHGRSFGIRKIKEILVSDIVKKGDFDAGLRLQCSLLKMGTSYFKYFENTDLLEDFKKNTFKDPIPFNPTTSIFYSEKRLKKVKKNLHLFKGGLVSTIFEEEKIIKVKPSMLIEFVKFDGNLLRVDVQFNYVKKTGRNEFLTSKYPYSYQVLFVNGMVDCINWEKVYI